jgi:hypothetical protein
MERIENADALDVERLLAVIENRACRTALDPQRLEPFDSPDEIRGEGRRGLDLHRREHALLPYEQIDLASVGVPEEIELRNIPESVTKRSPFLFDPTRYVLVEDLPVTYAEDINDLPPDFEDDAANPEKDLAKVIASSGEART